MNKQEYYKLDACAMRDLIAAGEIKSREVLEQALALLDAAQPQLNAMAFDWREEALELASKSPAGVFAGVPFLLKDLGADWFGHAETCGTRVLRHNVASFTKTFVQRYIDAGLIIFGRTTAPEYGLSCQTENRLHGVTRNPWNLAKNPGGSSGGAAALVAAGVLPAAHASDGGGSIRIPASLCGVIGLKPTRGRVPSGPMVGEGWAGLSTSHVVCRSMRDCAAFLDIAKGIEPVAPYYPYHGDTSYGDILKDKGKNSYRIAVAPDYAKAIRPTDAGIKNAIISLATMLEQQGHAVKAQAPGYSLEECKHVLWEIAGINSSLTYKMHREQQNSTSAVVDDIEPATRAFIEQFQNYHAHDYIRCLWRRDQLTKEYNQLFEEFDLLLSPVMPMTAQDAGLIRFQGDWEEYAQDMFSYMPYTPIANISGTPAISLPLGLDDQGLPIGVMLSAAYGREDILLQISRDIEQEMGGFNHTAPLLQS